MSNARITNADLAAAIAGLAEGQATTNRLLATLVEAQAPAKAAPKPKASAKPRKAQPKAAKPATKGAQTRGSLSRKDWNRTLTTKAKLAGGDTYKRVIAAWTEVQALRETSTPDEVLALFV